MSNGLGRILRAVGGCPGCSNDAREVRMSKALWGEFVVIFPAVDVIDVY